MQIFTRNIHKNTAVKIIILAHVSPRIIKIIMYKGMQGFLDKFLCLYLWQRS